MTHGSANSRYRLRVQRKYGSPRVVSFSLHLDVERPSRPRNGGVQPPTARRKWLPFAKTSLMWLLRFRLSNRRALS
jgi:hypothetical protein